MNKELKALKCMWSNKIKQRTKSIEEKFWEKVSITDPDECWEWMAFRDKDGYGQMRFAGKRPHASRIAYILTHGEISDYLCVCHHCDNPAHLFLGSPKDNTHDMFNKGRGRKGEQVNTAKLKAGEVYLIRSILKSKVVSQRFIAKMFKVTEATISDIKYRKSWRHV